MAWVLHCQSVALSAMTCMPGVPEGPVGRLLPGLGLAAAVVDLPLYYGWEHRALSQPCRVVMCTSQFGHVVVRLLQLHASTRVEQFHWSGVCRDAPELGLTQPGLLLQATTRRLCVRV